MVATQKKSWQVIGRKTNLFLVDGVQKNSRIGTMWDFFELEQMSARKKGECVVCVIPFYKSSWAFLAHTALLNWHQSNNTFRRKEKEDWEDQLRQRELKRSRINPRLDRDESLKRIENCCPGDSCICYIGEERPWVPTIYNRGLSPQNIVK